MKAISQIIPNKGQGFPQFLRYQSKTITLHFHLTVSPNSVIIPKSYEQNRNSKNNYGHQSLPATKHFSKKIQIPNTIIIVKKKKYHRSLGTESQIHKYILEESEEYFGLQRN